MGLIVDTPNGPFTLARSCDGCTLCCKVMRVDAPLDKPMNQWCVHCIPGTGCGIHETRPPVCRSFYCVWLMDGNLTEEWRPESCHMVLWLDLDGRRLNINADEDFPNAWRTEPFLTRFKALAAQALPQNGQVVAYVGREVFVILPDRYVPLGALTPDEYIFIERVADGSWDARKVDEAQAQALRAAGRA